MGVAIVVCFSDGDKYQVITLPYSAKCIPDLMDPQAQTAMMQALESLYKSDNLNVAWPAVFDIENNTGNAIPLEAVDIVVLPLDRVGAPPGASGASVFIAYFSYRNGGPLDPAPLVSPPLVVKIGDKSKLKSEYDFQHNWPTLSDEVRVRFAMPIFLYNSHPQAVLIAPFRSQFSIAKDGKTLGVRLKDLWGLLHEPEELLGRAFPHWASIESCVGSALAAVANVHRANKAQYARSKSSYRKAYDWYLRDTFGDSGTGKRAHIPKLLFGDKAKVTAFGQSWPNPSLIVKRLVENDEKFSGVFGPVHGDLHPKNIVIGHGDTVQIIDFGWATSNAHVVVDYLLLDINLRGTTLPSQIGEADVVKIAEFLDPTQSIADLHPLLQPRAKAIKEQIWNRTTDVVSDWNAEYLIPFFLVAYGLLVYLDAARNQPALIASVLAAGRRIESCP